MSKKFPLLERKILKRGELKHVSTKGGIYKIYIDKKKPRLKGKADVVYIGRGKNLRRRIASFWKGHGQRKGRYRFESLKENKFRLFYSFDECNNPEDAEKGAFESFEKKHLELPPLNRQG